MVQCSPALSVSISPASYHTYILVWLCSQLMVAILFLPYFSAVYIYIFIKIQERESRQRFRGNVNIISLPHDRNNSAITLTILNWFGFGANVCVSIYTVILRYVFFYSIPIIHAEMLPWVCSSEWYTLLHRMLLNTRDYITLQCISPPFFYQRAQYSWCTPIRAERSGCFARIHSRDM